MRIKDIKTREQFYDFADVWYQRTHKLREIWQDVDQSEERKEKAFRLWYIMYNRVMKLVNATLIMNQAKSLDSRLNKNESQENTIIRTFKDKEHFMSVDELISGIKQVLTKTK